jgi:hypothetical protein
MTINHYKYNIFIKLLKMKFMPFDFSDRNITSLDGLKLDKKLEYLYLYDNKIKEIGCLSSLTNLGILNLGNNKIKEIGCLSSLTNLGILNLRNNQINEIGQLSSLTNLINLSLQDNQIKEVGGLSSLINLDVVYLENNQIKEIGGLYSLTNLQYISLDGNQIPDWKYKVNKLLQRNSKIKWEVVKPQFIRYCFTLAPLNLPVDILIMIFDVNSYPNHLYQKWEIGKIIKDKYNNLHMQ